MGKLLRPQDRILLGLAIAADVFEVLRDPAGSVSSSYEYLYGFVPYRYKKHNFEARLKRSLKTGYIEKMIKDGEVYFRLTGQGEEKIIRDFPIISLKKKPWDRKWRIVIFDIPERAKRIREYLRAKLAELGFAMLQESVWITPFNIAEDLREYLETNHLEENVFVLVARRAFAEDEKVLIQKIWKLDKINNEYRKIWDKRQGGGKSLTGKEQKKLKNFLKNQYLEVLAIDPCLPRELLPGDWLGEKVRKLIKSQD